MPIYNKDGTQLASVYDADGKLLLYAYDKNGNVIYTLERTALKVMSYNIQWFSGINSYSSIQDEAYGTQNADIIGMQEYKNGGSIGGVASATYITNKGYDNLYISSKDTNHKAIASKYSMSDMEETVYTVSYETRSYTKAYFTIKGKTIAFFNTHLDYTPKATQYQQMQELFNAVAQEETFILTGDFNTFCSAVTDADYINMIKPFVDAGYNLANNTAEAGFGDTWTDAYGNTANPTGWWQTDNIITSSDIDITSVTIDRTKVNCGINYPIDHLPIIATLLI